MAQLKLFPSNLAPFFVAALGILLLAAAPAARAGDLSKLAVGTVANFTLSAKPRPVPVISFRDEQGRKRGLAEFTGKVVLVNFWATWCGPCRREMPDLDRLQARLGGPKFAVVAISSDRKGLPVVRKFYDKYKITRLDAFIDKTSKAQRKFGAFGLPTSVLIDAKGREVGRLVGPAEWVSAESLALIQAVIDGGGES